MSSKKLILVIGATGAQGLAVVDALLQTGPDGQPSPYAVRALTRDPNSARAQTLATRGVEVVKGSTDDLPSVLAALNGVYGAFVNTDSFTIGEEKEVFVGIRIFELAKQLGTIKHYVWSGLNHPAKIGGYDPKYYAEHHTAKGRVNDWMRSQASVVSDSDMSWSILNTCPYMDMLTIGMLGPLKVRADGTYVFASPIGTARFPLIALTDLGFFARYIFDHRAETSAQELDVASDFIDWPTLVATFTKVTGKKAEYVPLTVDEWMGLFVEADTARPIAGERLVPDGSTTWRENFTKWWNMYRAELIQRDMDALKNIHPGLLSVERWMRATGYTGDIGQDLLKNVQDGKGGAIRPNLEAIARL